MAKENSHSIVLRVAKNVHTFLQTQKDRKHVKSFNVDDDSIIIRFKPAANLAGIGDIERAKSNSLTTSSRPASCGVDLLLNGSSSRDAPRTALDILSQIPTCGDAGSGGGEGDWSSMGASITLVKRRGEESWDGSRKRSSTHEGRSLTADDVESSSSASSSTGKDNVCLGEVMLFWCV